MTNVATMADADKSVMTRVRAGDEAAFARLVERHEHELRAHCYRMLGSASEAEDLTQETFLRAWRSRERFEGRASFRTWLYRIATNACLDAAWRRTHPVTDPVGVGGHDAETGAPSPLEEAAPCEAEPDSRTVARDAVAHALLATIQRLPARQRAVLILRDVFGWSAVDSAALLDTTVPAANSALQRARATVEAHHSSEPHEWSPHAAPARRQSAVLGCLVAAHEQADGAAVALLAQAV